ncbi:MAG: enoyl-CoA hydratase/isomerase family protein [Rhodospirillales bacterium]|nr:enoyl-CoA hydratase/isomerase family protein [Rhodospirillales bacterium]
MRDTTGPVGVAMRGKALWITIDRESRRNALNRAVIEAIAAAIDGAETSREARAIVLTGAGERAFCAGADLTEGPAVFARSLDEPRTDFGRLARRMRECAIPSIARINGDCLAGGMGLAAMCDLAIAAPHARFGLPEAGVGVFPMQVLVFLRGMIGARAINELCLTGAFIDAARAREIGLVNEIAEPGALDARTEALVATLATMSPVALRRGKYAIAAMERMHFAEALTFAETQIAATAMTADAAEGIIAFRGKRKPRWSED